MDCRVYTANLTKYRKFILTVVGTYTHCQITQSANVLAFANTDDSQCAPQIGLCLQRCLGLEVDAWVDLSEGGGRPWHRRLAGQPGSALAKTRIVSMALWLEWLL